jgi:hypothetical protein
MPFRKLSLSLSKARGLLEKFAILASFVGWGAVGFTFFALCSGVAHAHCKTHHPHHCLDDAWDFVKDVGETVKGGTTKRAKMILSDPVGTALNPIKVIDEGIPTPLSYVEYIAKNPDEIIEVVKNPAAGAVGLPAAIAIADGRNAALKNGTKRMPLDVRVQLQPYFGESLLDSVRYTTDSKLYNGLLPGIALHQGGAGAITLVNVVVFKDAAKAFNIRIWAHEMFHVKQYDDMGLTEFSATYTLDHNAIERPAYRFDAYFSEVRLANVISLEVVIGLNGKCLARSGNTIGSYLHLSTCVPGNQLQRWSFSRTGTINVTGSTRCIEVTGSNTSNRTRPRLAECNQEKRQRFAFTKRGELRSALRKDYCLEVAGGFTADGTPVQMFDCNKTDSQVWINPTVKLISAPGAPVQNQCLRASDLKIGTAVSLGPCRKSDILQAWASANHGGKLRLLSVPDGCLQVRQLQGQWRLEIASCTDEDDQEFEVTMKREVRSDVAKNLCLDVESTNTPIAADCVVNRKTQQWN